MLILSASDESSSGRETLTPPLRGQSLWLRLASIDDPDYGRGVPWGIGRLFFDALEARGLVRRDSVSTRKGRSDCAVITEAGVVELEAARFGHRRGKARRQEKAARAQLRHSAKEQLSDRH